MTTPDVTAEDRHHLHWATALDRLELEVVLAERMLVDPSRPQPDAWHEPLLEGVIPVDLRERAIALQERQLHLQAELAALLAAVARQHEFANRVDRATRRPDRPVYLDVTA
jgi:hypothetical protein